MKRLLFYGILYPVLILLACSSDEDEHEHLVLSGDWQIESIICTIIRPDSVEHSVECNIIGSICKMNFIDSRYSLSYNATFYVHPYDTLPGKVVGAIWDEWRYLLQNNGDQHTIDSLEAILFPTGAPIDTIYFSRNETGSFTLEDEWYSTLLGPCYFFGTIYFIPDSTNKWNTFFKSHEFDFSNDFTENLLLENVPDSLSLYIKLFPIISN